MYCHGAQSVGKHCKQHKPPYIYIILIYIVLWTILSCDTDGSIPPVGLANKTDIIMTGPHASEMCQPHKPAQCATPRYTQEQYKAYDWFIIISMTAAYVRQWRVTKLSGSITTPYTWQASLAHTDIASSLAELQLAKPADFKLTPLNTKYGMLIPKTKYQDISICQVGPNTQ